MGLAAIAMEGGTSGYRILCNVTPTKNHFAFAVPDKAIVDDFYLWKLKPAEGEGN